jgi:hypothetical protein
MTTTLREKKQPHEDSLTVLREYFKGTRLPWICDARIHDNELASAIKWLEPLGQVPTLLFFPRLVDRYLTRIEHCSPCERASLLKESAEARYPAVREAVIWAAEKEGLSDGGGVVFHPYMHCFAIRRPKKQLLRLLGSSLCQGRDRIVAGVIPNYYLQTLEASLSGNDEAKNRRQRLEELVKEMGKEPDGYLNSLGVGDFSENWGRVSENGDSPRGCILDSGADESHIALQQQVLVHALFDGHGQFKHARDAFDHGCHGTKMSSIICANPMAGQYLGLPREINVRLGVNSRTKLAVVNVTQGPCFAEVGTLGQLAGGLDWVVENKDHPQWGGFQVVNLSLELRNHTYSHQVQTAVDRLLEICLFNQLLPILASGNDGPKGVSLGTKGVNVGAMDRKGGPVPANGSRVDLIAPGEHIICCQPPLPQLDHDVVSVYSGSSQAAAFVTGIVLHLIHKTDRSAFDCMDALIRQRGKNKQIDPKKAIEDLL